MKRNSRVFSSTKYLSLALLAFASGCQTPAAHQFAPESKFKEVRNQIEALVQNGELKGVSVGFIENGEVTWAESFGVADAEAGRAASIHTPFGVASMGKAITAAAAMTLVQSGKLELEASVDGILGPGMVRIEAGNRAPTVRELLNMTSGIPHGAVTYDGAEPVDEDFVLAEQSFVAFPAGSTFHYSNFSMALMERIIEKASGRSYHDYVADALFRPLGMEDSRIGVGGDKTAVRYRADGTRFGSLTPYPRSSRQISASLNDLLQFASMNLQIEVHGGESPLSAKSIETLQNEKSALPGAHIALGIGNFELGDGRRMIASSGNDMGVQSSMFLIPESGLGAIVLSNSSGYQSDEIAVSMLDAAAPGVLDLFIKIATEFEGRTKPFQPDDRWTGSWSGMIAGHDREIPISISIGDAGLTASIEGAPAQSIADAAIRDGLLTGSFEGVLPLFESPEGPHSIEISLIAEGDRLYGFALANFRSARGKFEIPAAMSLRRTD